jgi:AcrR family transcriptional regulator
VTLEAYRAEVARRKRGAILDAALALFLEHGYDRTQIDAVAKHAGVSSATLYKHFGSKAALFGGIMARFWQQDEETRLPSPAPGDPRAGLSRIGAHYAELLARPDLLALFRVVIAEAPRFPELGEALYARGKKPYLDGLGDYIRAEIAHGTLAVDDVDLAVRQFLGMINDVVFWPRTLLPGLAVGEGETRGVVVEAVETFLARYGTSR